MPSYGKEWTSNAWYEIMSHPTADDYTIELSRNRLSTYRTHGRILDGCASVVWEQDGPRELVDTVVACIYALRALRADHRGFELSTQ